jgi:hypothetical protein
LSLEYWAGFFDGEGSIGLYRNGNGVWHLRTQLTQNQSAASTQVLGCMRDKFGGNISLRGTRAYNWQLNSAGAAHFLAELLPYLKLKFDQARVAVTWYAVSQRPVRDSRGRHTRYDRDRLLDVNAAKLIKLLKKVDLDEALELQADLRGVAAQLLGQEAQTNN